MTTADDHAVRQDVIAHYMAALPAAYLDDADEQRVRNDIDTLEVLQSNDFRASTQSDGARRWRFTLIVSGQPVALSEILPVLQSLDVYVLDQRPYPVTSRAGLTCWIYDFGIDPGLSQEEGNDEQLRALFTDAFTACWTADAEADPFNRLVVNAAMPWRQVAVLRGYAKYLRQVKFPYSQTRIASVLSAHPATVRALWGLFAATFDPDQHDRRDAAARATTLQQHLDAIESLEEDRILRAMRDLICATIRTNYYRDDHGDGEDARKTLAFKLNPQAIPLGEMPQPVPRFEIFVCSPDVEGVHLRYGPVARGGLRWSDRREDYRTEILGLVKAQAAKNAVIVPVGAKGGFVVKRSPAATGDPVADRQALLDNGIGCYRRFIGALLDVTDNLDPATGAVVPPPRVRRLDDDDPYLVVAADKGTATFSDIANEVAAQHGFWLTDAFASGGSVGYDHKAMGITALGAWESVKRHFRELDRDVQSDDFTAVGIGDMSGDVFGNAMLLSERTRLVAAFDHRHIFLDPDPDAERSYHERQRLFALPRSSWADYDRSLISRGGGVWPRNVKRIAVSPEVGAALGVVTKATTLTPADLIRAILQAPVDLLFNGGVGTFIKASTETHRDAGDKMNDALRVDADTVRAGVIGEGGNLGVTPWGRIEFARQGGRINTDALDNSAGVSCSDREVNIKILLSELTAAHMLTVTERDDLLRDMTTEVGELVLADNRSQNLLLGISRGHAGEAIGVHARMICDLQTRHGLNVQLEALPSPEEIQRRNKAGTGLTSPELATLIAHVKLATKRDLLADPFVADDALLPLLAEYFPAPVRQRHPPSLAAHHLRREIVATLATNAVVDRGGLSFVYRISQDTGATTADTVRAFMAVTAIFDLSGLWSDICDAPLPAAVADPLLLDVRRVLDRASRWLLTHRPQPLDVPAEVDRFSMRVQDNVDIVSSLLKGSQADDLRVRISRSVDQGVSLTLATRVHLLLDQFGLLDIIEVAETTGRDVPEVADLYFALSDRLSVVPMLQSVSKLPHDSRWGALARLSLRDDLYGSMRSLCRGVLATAEPHTPTGNKIGDWEYTNTSRLRRARSTLTSALDSDRVDIARMAVAIRQIRNLTPLTG